MKSYPGKLWKIMNDNGTELQQARFSNIEHRRCGWPRGSAPNSNPHSKYLLQTEVGSTPRFEEERPKRLWHVTPGPLFDTSKIGAEITVSCVNKSHIRYGGQPKSYPVQCEHDLNGCVNLQQELVTNSRKVTLRARASNWSIGQKWNEHWSEMKTYQTALSGK